MKKYYKYYGDIGADGKPTGMSSALNQAEDFIEEVETVTKHDILIQRLAKRHVHTLDTISRHIGLNEEATAERAECLELIGAIEALK